MIFYADDPRAGDPRPTALFAAAASEAAANSWTSVNGWAAPRVFTTVEDEYDAVRRGVGVVDFCPIARYTVRGADAAPMLSRLTSAPVEGLVANESARGLILDDHGAVVDIVEAARLSSDLFLLCASRPHARRIQLATRGFDCATDDITDAVAALALVGPKAQEAASAAGIAVESGTLAAQLRVRGVEASARPIHIGGLPALEIIYPKDEALTLWERLRRAARPKPVGLDALEIHRIEGGAPRAGLDFSDADHASRAQRRIPAEIGLPHLAPLGRAWFNGRRALRAAPVRRRLVTLRFDADAVVPGAPVFNRKTEVGRVTSSAFSPRLRGAIAFADIAADAVGKTLEVACGDQAEGGGRIPATLLETAESGLARSYIEAERSATESRSRAV